MAQIGRLLMVVLGLLLLGALGFLIAAWANRWPRVQKGFMRLGDAAITFALGIVGLWMVLLVLRATGLLPAPH